MQVNPATASLYIANPLSGSGMASLFSTHPPIAVRIERLRAFDAAQRLVGRDSGPPARTAPPGDEYPGMAATQEALYGPARPRALVVRGGAPRAGADEARPSSPSRTSASSCLSSSRRSSTVCRAGRSCARPVCGLRDDARAGARVGPRRDRGRRRRLQLPADARQDAPPQPRRDPPRPALGARAGRGASSRTDRCPPTPRRTCSDWYAPRAAPSSSISGRFVDAGRVGRRAARRPRARRALRPTHDPLRPRLSPASRRRSRTGATSTVGRAARWRRRGGSCSATRSTRSIGSRRFAAVRARRGARVRAARRRA